MVGLGEAEDEWDNLIEKESGRTVTPLSGSWMAASQHELYKVNHRLVAEGRKNAARIERYMGVIDEEIALKKQETSAKATSKRARQRRRARERRNAEELGRFEEDINLERPAPT